ncbi:hypothetical protein [Haloglomus litoreum]|uniref:hypothetical protein n=1 Tax=Haloglomus litoreum TaxID=3034026 RepID=UPI0023E854DD|nr:hypothetical protein [Haloglomus sp. DT116]
MGVVVIAEGRCQPDTDVVVEELDTTAWLTGGSLFDSGSAIVRNTLHVRCNSGSLDSLEFVIAGEVGSIQDCSDIYRDEDYVEYITTFVDQAGTVEQEQDGVVYYDGETHRRINRLTVRETREFDRGTLIHTELDEPISAGEDHLITLQYRRPDFASPFVPVLSKRQEIDTRIYSIYDVWGDAPLMSQVRDMSPIPVEDVGIWFGLPPGRSPVSLRPAPDRQTSVVVQHPGYAREELETEGYTGIFWSFEAIECEFAKDDVEVHCQYDDITLSWRLVVISLLLTILGTAAGLLTLL